MPLITCPECKSNISSCAKSCPHCGYPLAEHIKKEEIKQLLDQIVPVDFQCPEPRAKVCIKCGCSFFYSNNKNNPNFDTPMCDCGYPGVEVDYPQQGRISHIGASLYILEHDIIPRHIGDIKSEEYNLRVSSLRKRTTEKKINPIPPDPGDFGVYPSTEPLMPHTSHAPAQASFLPRCPYCSSTDLTKITITKKAGKTFLFGLLGALDDAGKTYKCNNCGGKF